MVYSFRRAANTMIFHHLIEINDPLNPLIEPLSRRQLWHGLVMRAELPKLFVPHLDSCTLSERTAESVARELSYGDLVIRDNVHYFPQEKVIFRVPAQGEIPASSLQMAIEERQPEVFFVRFDYDDGNGETESTVDAFYNDFRRSAYTESDIDTIRIIREMAAQGRLEAPTS
jgi:hypothetical protein